MRSQGAWRGVARGLEAISLARSFSSTTMLRKVESTCRGATPRRAGPLCPLCSPKRPQLGWSLWPSTGSVASTSQDADVPLQRSQKQLGYREWERHMSLTRMSWYNPHHDEGACAAAAAAAEFPTEEAPRQSDKGGPDDRAQYEQLKQQILRNVGFEDDGEEEESAKPGGEDGSRAQAALNPNPRPKTHHDYMILRASGSADTNRRDGRDNQGPGRQMKEESKYSINKEDKYSDAHTKAWVQWMKEKGKYSKNDDDKYSGAKAGVQQNTQATTPNVHHFTLEQLKELETIFQQTPYPCLVLRNYLARLMNVTEGRIKRPALRQYQIWFRHRRSKLRRLRIMPYTRSQKNPVTSNLGENCRDSQQPDQIQTSPNQDPGPTQVPMAPMPSQGPRPNQAPMAPVRRQGPQPNQVPVVPMPNQVPVVPVLSAVPILILMPSQVPVVVPYSILPLMPLVPMLSPAYPPGLPPPYPVLPVAVPTVFPGFVPIMQPVLPNIPVYPQPMPPRCLPPIVPIWFVTVNGPFPLLY